VSRDFLDSAGEEILVLCGSSLANVEFSRGLVSFPFALSFSLSFSFSDLELRLKLIPNPLKAGAAGLSFGVMGLWDETGRVPMTPIADAGLA
jgi:hypothetical protein